MRGFPEVSAVRILTITPVGLALFACGGFMEDSISTGSRAAQRMGAMAGTPLPSSTSSHRVVETTGIDWILNGEAQGPRNEVEAWFNSLVLPCDQGTVTGPMTEPPFFRMLGRDSDWTVPLSGLDWQTKGCESSNFSGPHYSVSISKDGEPAWIWVHGMTM